MASNKNAEKYLSNDIFFTSKPEAWNAWNAEKKKKKEV